MIIERVDTEHTPETLAGVVQGFPGVVLLLSGRRDMGRFSILAAEPFLKFRSLGVRCEIVRADGTSHVQFGNPWDVLEPWIARYELSRQPDVPFPLGGCFGFWGYELGRFNDPAMEVRAEGPAESYDCHLGFYASLIVWDHHLNQVLIVATGLQEDGDRTSGHARRAIRLWRKRMELTHPREELPPSGAAQVASNMTRKGFIRRVTAAQEFIRAGHIYQVNLAQRFTATWGASAWSLFQRLSAVSPAPLAAYYDAGTSQVVSSSPELFLKMSGSSIMTRPIKGTRPRSNDPARDTQYSFELQTSAKEAAELVMITDLLRNDLGRCCNYGSVHVPELMVLERFAHVQHLISTVRGELKPAVSHLAALRACFPGGSVTGAPKLRAMQIIRDLEPCARGPYTGALGYLGWNGESQLSILIRTAVASHGKVRFHAGAGIVADSDPEAEFEETLAKAGGFLQAIRAQQQPATPIP